MKASRIYLRGDKHPVFAGVTEQAVAETLERWPNQKLVGFRATWSLEHMVYVCPGDVVAVLPCVIEDDE